MKNCFCWPVRVYYEDTDHGGVVYNANYLKFMERCRTELLREQGLEQDSLINNQDLIFAVRSTQIEFFSPAKFNDQLFVTAEIQKANRARVDFLQTIFRFKNTVPEIPAGFVNKDSVFHQCDRLSEASVSVVALGAKALKPKRMPESLFKELMREH